ncbi:MAG TPA: ATP-grasp domain-containing protein [Polyangia bacterium]|jgi:biotin carboxylase|nr:ATP-grasp domain-containing protein [Polyangia bacterium]
MNAPRIVLVIHTTSYGVPPFMEACRKVGAEVIVASDRCHVLDSRWVWPPNSVVIDFFDPEGAAAVIAGVAPATTRAVLSVGGETAALVATAAARRLGLPSNDPAAVAATGNKLRMRTLCAAAAAAGRAVPIPAFFAIPLDADPAVVADRVTAELGWPCVIKPLLLSASRGVMRVDDAAGLRTAMARLARLLSAPALREMDPVLSQQALLEAFVPGREVALEALLADGQLRPLALFDKPDPLDGPFFEETLYVTPSRLPEVDQRAVLDAVAAATRALGLSTGPVHAELRMGPGGPVVIEVAARPIGGLCARTLRFDAGLSLEELIVRQALGQDVRHVLREQPASGVMMIPIPAAGILKGAAGVEEARQVSGIEDVIISIKPGERVVPLPEGDRYLGFIFARAASPAAVEAALRAAHAHLRFAILPTLPMGDRAPPQ